ncbi:hypothetical protein BJF79_03200 [Actinomadura sp. CNU-125]|nr:hypothetical protein BJF79_03200 [Actinomadura sp. CNU-125]
MQVDGRAAHAPARLRRVEGGVAHALGAARDDHVADAGLDLHGGVQDRLESGSAAAVELGAADLDGQPGVQRGDAADRGGVGVGVALSEDDFVDRVAGQAGALDERPDDGGGQLDRRDGLQYPAEPADRGPQRLADDRFAHVHAPQLVSGGAV